MNPHVTAISTIGEEAWTAIHYPDAFAAPDTGELASDAEATEIEYTAFTGHPKAEHVTARLIVRRVRRVSTEATSAQGELPTSWPLPSALHRQNLRDALGRAAAPAARPPIEQVIADGRGSALAHLPPTTSRRTRPASRLSGQPKLYPLRYLPKA